MITEVVTLEGHLIDSKLLADVLDEIISAGGEFQILEVHIGQSRNERSHALLEVRSETREGMQGILDRISRHGALWHADEDADIQVCDIGGAFPEEFFVTTNQQTYVRAGNEWVEVRDQQMDCGILHDPHDDSFRCIPMYLARVGDRIVCGQRGLKVIPFERPRARGVFEFMNSDISVEKPKATIIRQCAEQMAEARRAGKRMLLVAGAAVIHTGASEHVIELIRRGYVSVLFGGNAIAAHDVEHHLFGTSLGVYVDKATRADAGHENHIRAVNTIRRAGGIRAAIDAGVLTDGILYACHAHGVELVLAGSLRDDGPFPEVITDMVAAQERMRSSFRGVGFALMLATALHSIAACNLLPASVPVVCVDISSSVLTKLADRGSLQTLSLVTDVEPFLRSLLQWIREIESGE